MKIAIVNYQTGNLASIQKKLHLLGSDFFIANTPDELQLADKIILPGVGHFGMAMEHLRNGNWIESLTNSALKMKVPTLGICLGMQLMLSHSEEGDALGLNWFNGKIVRFHPENKLKYKVPHIGWNTINIQKEHPINNHLTKDSSFYFVHSYHALLENDQDCLHTTHYSYSFASAIAKENIIGVQYHPEKSHDVGQELLKNFLSL